MWKLLITLGGLDRAPCLGIKKGRLSRNSSIFHVFVSISAWPFWFSMKDSMKQVSLSSKDLLSYSELSLLFP